MLPPHPFWGGVSLRLMPSKETGVCALALPAVPWAAGKQKLMGRRVPSPAAGCLADFPRALRAVKVGMTLAVCNLLPAFLLDVFHVQPRAFLICSLTLL